MSAQIEQQLSTAFVGSCGFLSKPNFQIPNFDDLIESFRAFINECKQAGIKPSTQDGDTMEDDESGDGVYLRYIVKHLEDTIYIPDANDPSLLACRSLEDLKAIFVTNHVDNLRQKTAIKLDRKLFAHRIENFTLSQTAADLNLSNFQARAKDRWIIAPGANIHIVNNNQWLDSFQDLMGDKQYEEGIVTTSHWSVAAGITRSHNARLIPHAVSMPQNPAPPPSSPPPAATTTIPDLSTTLPHARIKGAGTATLWLVHPDGNPAAENDTNRYQKLTLHNVAGMASAHFNLLACTVPEHMIYKKYDIVAVHRSSSYNDDDSDGEDNVDEDAAFGRNVLHMVRKGAELVDGHVVGEAVYNEGLYEVQHVPKPVLESWRGATTTGHGSDAGLANPYAGAGPKLDGGSVEAFLARQGVMVGREVEVDALEGAKEMEGRKWVP